MSGISGISLARFTAVCRLAIGTGFILAPEFTMRPWIGRDVDRPTSRLLTRVIGTRDLVLGAGTLATASASGPLPKWLAAALAADAADLVLTVANRDHLPRSGSALVAAIAGGGVALGAAALAGVRRSC